MQPPVDKINCANACIDYQEEVVVPKEPPPEYEFLADPPSISAFDLGKLPVLYMLT
jgi:hypothetical protein